MLKYLTLSAAIVCLSLLAPISSHAQNLQVNDLMVEYMHNPAGISSLSPRFSWKLTAAERNTLQAGYEIRVKNDKGKVWDSGVQHSDRSVNVIYAGPALTSKTKYYWQVRISDNHGHTTKWSNVNFWQMGLLQPGDWSAKWISVAVADTVKNASPMFRKAFRISKNIKSAMAYITAHGLYEAHLNGAKIGDKCLTPGWTSYNNRVLYQSYDVTPMLKKGDNAIGFVLGNGWYSGGIAHNTYGTKVSGLLQLEITYADGSKDLIKTDESWKYNYGPVRYADIYNGETYDARLEKAGWDQSGFNDADWKAVGILPFGPEAITSSIGPSAGEHEIFKPVKLIQTPLGETVIDFGQNLVGWVRFKVKGPAGTVIKISHAEMLDKPGNFYTANLRGARQQIQYTLKGSGEETYEPRFTYQGFRYIKIEGYPGKVNPDDFAAIAVYSDMKTTGSFACSNPLINQLQHNITWGQKGNFVDVPTDCPQRDERLGWTGDAQAFSRTAAFNMDVVGFFTKWLADMKADQQPDGAVPFVIPNVLGKNAVASTGWADVATIVPWNMYLAYGDEKLLADQYGSMKAWVDYMTAHSSGDLWNRGTHFGDWLFYSPGDDNDGKAAITDKYLIAQIFYTHSVQLLINAAQVLNKQNEVTKYTDLLTRLKKAFIHEYVTPNGRLVSGTQTAYVLALNFDMLPENLRAQAVDRLVDNIGDYRFHITTGFLGTPYICQVLTRFGHLDMAYRLLLQETFPSWLYPVKLGATTIWERWDGVRTDGSFEAITMNSFNHYAYGAIGDWMYRTIAGLDNDDTGPGYKRILIAPRPGGNLTSAKAELETMYGKVVSGWKIDSAKFRLMVIIPPNATATVVLPNASGKTVTEGGELISASKDISNINTDGPAVKLNVGSGTYNFEYGM
ncbi:alpha-L-rhamnosidase [Mucilaginibacter sp. PPCGB 2223]|uniref:glycoside hydrolase family 78 protein n=1 Tax=Mucilaginibacter sp. PPCGB 2223 TaxID=1886027 RepID=UPI0008247BB8|nr:glycoside hydrolase family 78 protein [Mucilaginibacter sp. PPCGB 2223]OCX52510.1 alpha-L-rhamnosidase [Mucilaginibacter sp. PPCGB 2223]